MSICPRVSRLLTLSAALSLPASIWAAEPAATNPRPTNQERIDLTPRLTSGDLAQVTAEMTMGGTLKVPQKDGKPGEAQEIPTSVTTTLHYDECRFTPTTGTRPTRSARYYDQAEDVIKVDSDGQTQRLADERRLITVTNPGGRLLMSSPGGPLLREELDMIDAFGDSLIVDGLLPTQPVADGESWGNDGAVLAGLLSLDSVANCDVQSVLDKFNADFALSRLEGTVVGTFDGAATEMEIKGVYLFDRKLGRVTKLNLAVKEKRAIGGATRGLDGVAKLKMNIVPLATSEHLTPEVLTPLRAATAAPTADALQLDGTKQGFRLLHDRKWFVTNKERETTTLRRVEQDDVIAQCTIASLPTKSAGRQTTLDQFIQDIRVTLKDDFGQLVSSRQWTNSHGHHCLEAVVRGKADDVPVEWHYYLVAPESGNRVSAAFTIDGQMVDRLGGADRALVNALELVPIANRVANAPAAPQK
jgi:hypothetical protein